LGKQIPDKRMLKTYTVSYSKVGTHGNIWLAIRPTYFRRNFD